MNSFGNSTTSAEARILPLVNARLTTRMTREGRRYVASLVQAVATNAMDITTALNTVCPLINSFNTSKSQKVKDQIDWILDNAMGNLWQNNEGVIPVNVHTIAQLAEHAQKQEYISHKLSSIIVARIAELDGFINEAWISRFANRLKVVHAVDGLENSDSINRYTESISLLLPDQIRSYTFPQLLILYVTTRVRSDMRTSNSSLDDPDPRIIKAEMDHALKNLIFWNH